MTNQHVWGVFHAPRSCRPARPGASASPRSPWGSLPFQPPQAAAPDSSEKKPYVVILKDRSNAKGVANDHSRRFGVKVKTVYDKGLRGYAGAMTDEDALKVAREPGVVIAPDTEVTGFGTQNVAVTPGPYMALPTGWGSHLDRVDQRNSLANSTPAEKGWYNYTQTGAQVTAYVIDSGVNYNHVEFGTRASAGFDAHRAKTHADFGKDCNGHGTHVAGILGGRNFGVAKDVSIVSVRVLDCNASGSVSNVVAGINYVTAIKKANPGKAMVANMSLGGGANTALDQAVRDSITAGITYASPGQVGHAMAEMATLGKVNGTNVVGAKLLYAPWTDPDLVTAADKLDDSVASPPPPPPPRCVLFCLFG